MRLTIEGEKDLYRKFKGVTKAIQNTFWGYVRTDLEKNLLDNVKPHVSGADSKIERNVYSKKIDDGVQAGIRNDGMLVNHDGRKVNYAVFVNSGTKGPYPIKPKDKKALRWTGADGAYAFAKEVTHPGIKASNFIERSAKSTFERLDDMFTKALRHENAL